MILKDLHIGPSDKTPEIFLKSEGTILIRGRGLIINKFIFFDDVSEWISEYVKNPAEVTRVLLSFEYLNSYTLSFLVSILRTLKVVNRDDDTRLSVSWYHEEDDEDMKERGIHLAHVTDLHLNFIQVDDIPAFNSTKNL